MWLWRSAIVLGVARCLRRHSKAFTHPLGQYVHIAQRSVNIRYARFWSVFNIRILVETCRTILVHAILKTLLFNDFLPQSLTPSMLTAVEYASLACISNSLPTVPIARIEPSDYEAFLCEKGQERTRTLSLILYVVALGSTSSSVK